MSITCPVCGYDKINETTLKWSICPSCGTQFGLSDNGRTYAQLRHDWIQGGATWQDDYILPPPYWSPINQLRNIEYNCTLADRLSINGRETMLMAAVTVASMGGYKAEYIAGTTGRMGFIVANVQIRSANILVLGTMTKAKKPLRNSLTSYDGLQVCPNF